MSSYLLLVLVEQLRALVQVPPRTLLDLCAQLRLLLLQLLDIHARGPGSTRISLHTSVVHDISTLTSPC